MTSVSKNLNALENFAQATFIVAMLALSSPVSAQARVPIVATTTDLKSLAEAVGGERVSVVALVPPNSDAEEYQPKPQDLNRLKSARLTLRVGLDYDLWFDKLVRQ